jgi:D-glycero-D-manno-heptose 1,7-bisphosphate phosphatase
MKSKAVFLDRDGVINPLVYNPNTSEYESPHYPGDFSIYTYVIKSLRLIKKHGYKIIIVSNQPSYAKGKTSLENIKAIEKLLSDFSAENGELIDEYYYCYHHPDGIVPEYAISCRCRKPNTLFLEKAVEKFGLNKEKCCFIGDQDADIMCGKAMGFYTIKIDNKHSMCKSGTTTPDDFASDLYDAALKIAKLHY